MSSAVTLFTISFFSQFVGLKGWSFLEDRFPASVIEDAYLDAQQLMDKYRYPGETHYVTTADGYIIGMHRLARPGSRPVFLFHGMFDSSSAWVVLGPSQALGYRLYHAGYDVWMGNARGNRYSRNHTFINPNSADFWTFSWHEIGYYDLPAMVDYILNKTHFSSMSYVGHSQGGTAFFVMCSARPEYNSKINVMLGLAPGVFYHHVRLPHSPLILRAGELLVNLIHEVSPRTELLIYVCFNSDASMRLCLEVVGLIMGRDLEAFNHTMGPALIGHSPAGANYKQMIHYFQQVYAKTFQQYDYGPLGNQQRYGQLKPPIYPLEKVTVPVALFYAQNDNLVSVEDTRRLAKTLRNVIVDHLAPFPQWSHISITLSDKAREYMHPRIVDIITRYNRPKVTKL